MDFDQGTATVVIANCFEALENGPSEGPNCMFTSGFLAGLFAEVFDKTIQANEIRCISQGQPECEFQLSLVEKTDAPDGVPAEFPSATMTVQGPATTVSGQAPDGLKDIETGADSKPVAVESGSKGKGETATTQSPGSETQTDLDAGVERASRIAKRKQHFWEKMFKK